MAGTISTSSGLISGYDWGAMITQMIAAQKSAKVTPLENNKTKMQDRLTAWQSFNTALSNITNYIDLNKLGSNEGYSTFSSALRSADSSVTPANVLSASLGKVSGPGSYAIEVTELARAEKISTDSFLSKIADLNLSGEIIINGHTVSIENSDSLSKIAVKINAAGAGVTASVLSISASSYKLTLENAATGAGVMDIRNGSGGDLLESLKLHTGVEHLGHLSGSDALSNAFNSKTAVIGTLLGLSAPQSGTIRILDTDHITWKDISVDLGTDTLETLKTKIESAGLTGVTVSIEENTTGGISSYQLKLTNTDGTDHFEDSGNMLESLGFLAGTRKNVLRTGIDASLEIDGNPVTSSSNTVSGAIEGVNLNLTGTNAGKPVTLNITQDNSSVTQRASSLVQTINSALSFVKAQNTFNASSSPPLMGDISLQTIRNTMSSTIFETIDGNSMYKTLSDIGIGFSKDGNGTISLNTDTLSAALSTNRDEALNALKQLSDNLYEKLNVFVDPYTGTISDLKKALETSMTGIDKKIAEINRRLEQQQALLEKKFNNLEILISQSNLTKNWLTQQVDYMSGKNNT
jgi:flagellar hook-associated protein 2